jgi:hypothetical protein
MPGHERDDPGSCREPGEDLLGERLDVLGHAERIALGDPHGAQLAGPWIEVSEYDAMEAAQVCQVVAAG